MGDQLGANSVSQRNGKVMTFTADDFTDMLVTHHAMDGRQHEFAMNFSTLGSLRELQSRDSRYVLERAPYQILGFQVRIDATIPRGEVRLERLEWPFGVTTFI